MPREFFDAMDRKLLAVLRGLFERGGSPERMARGIAAGVLGAFFPSDVLRFVVAFLAALFFRGNKAAAFIAPLLAGVFEIQAITHFEANLAAVAWPSGARLLALGVLSLEHANFTWDWMHPLGSLLNEFKAFQGMGTKVALALAGASGGLGFFAGAATYPVALIALSFFYDAKYRTQEYLNLAPRKSATPFTIPKPAGGPKLKNFADLRADYCDPKRSTFHCDSVRLLIDGGEAFPEMLAGIASARSTLVLETYILRDDKFGKLFADALKTAARRGVRTRALVDGVGSMGLSAEFLAELAAAGVAVRVFHPLGSFWRGGFGFLQRRDHRKIIIADQHVSFIGGLNIADEYAAVADGGGGWRDTHIRLDGAEPARILTEIFEETWRKGAKIEGLRVLGLKVQAPKNQGSRADRSTGSDLSSGFHESISDLKEKDGAQANESAALDGKATSTKLFVQIVSNRELLQRVQIKRAYLRAIRAAKRYILIENAFFIPDRDVLKALYKAVRRGVVVAVVVAMSHDIRIAALASHALYDELLAHGVRLFEYPPSMIHSKVAVIDDCWSIVSSYNLNHRSLYHDLEVGAIFFDERFAGALRDQILLDIAKCNELTKELHRSRPWNIALSESLCYQFRYWL